MKIVNGKLEVDISESETSKQSQEEVGEAEEVEESILEENAEVVEVSEEWGPVESEQ